jgi:hypothetical protein
MLKEALEVAYRHKKQEQEKLAVAQLLEQLPVSVLKEIAQTGTVKLAYLCGPDGEAKAWVEQFKGTPFFQQAIALEQEDLQAQMAQQQSSKVQRQKMDQEYEVMDQIRLKKKLLELQKARNEAQVLDGGGGPANATGSQVPGGEQAAQGAGALGPVDPQGQQGGGDPSKLGSVKTAMDPKLTMALQKAAPAMKGPGAVKMSLKPGDSKLMANQIKRTTPAPQVHVEADPFPTQKAAAAQAIAEADAWGRELARADFSKMAKARSLQKLGSVAGSIMAKRAAAAAGAGGLIEWALAHPHQAGAIVGGGIGAVHGLMKQDGGIGSAISEGAAGAGAGALAGGAAKAIHAGSAAGKDVGESLKGYGSELVGHAKNLSTRIKEEWEKAPKPNPNKLQGSEPTIVSHPPEAALGKSELPTGG